MDIWGVTLSVILSAQIVLYLWISEWQHFFTVYIFYIKNCYCLLFVCLCLLHTSFGCWVKFPRQTGWSRLLAEVWVWIPTKATCFKPLSGSLSVMDASLEWQMCAAWGLIDYIHFLKYLILDMCYFVLI